MAERLNRPTGEARLDAPQENNDIFLGKACFHKHPVLCMDMEDGQMIGTDSIHLHAPNAPAALYNASWLPEFHNGKYGDYSHLDAQDLEMDEEGSRGFLIRRKNCP